MITKRSALVCSSAPSASCPAASTARFARSSAVGASPLFIRRASGARIEDVDGNRYIDYVMSWGPLIHGHAPRGLVQGAGRGGAATAPASARRARSRSSSASASAR